MAGIAPPDEPLPLPAGIEDCWRGTGMTGDRSCPELAHHRHCRNCPRYHAAARRLLDLPLSDDERAQRAERLAQAPDIAEADGERVIAFRVGRDWLALDAEIVAEIATLRVVRSLPHRGGGVLGIVNVRGRILPCIALGPLLGIAGAEAPGPRPSGGRLLVFGREPAVVAAPVDEVAGLVTIRAADRLPTSGATGPGDTVVAWQGRNLVRLEARRLLDAVERGLA